MIDRMMDKLSLRQLKVILFLANWGVLIIAAIIFLAGFYSFGIGIAAGSLATRFIIFLFKVRRKVVNYRKEN